MEFDMASFLPLLATMAAGGLAGLGGSKPKTSSTYSGSQRSSIDEILDAIKGMKGGSQDITQNPNYQQGQQWNQNLFNDQDFFNSFEAPLQRQFQEQTVPDLANRFASMGSGGSLGSTAFRNQLGREGSNLSTNIAALRGGMQQRGVDQSLQYAQQPFSNLMQLYQQALQPTQNQYQPPSAGFFGPILSAITGGAAQGYGQQWGQSMAPNGGQQQQNNNQQNNPMAGARAQFAGQYPGTY
jgi:hypothetical protein